MSETRSRPLASLHASSPSYQPLIPTALLPYIAFVLLSSVFLSAFYFTTLPKKKSISVTEIVVGILASLQAGLGVVALFNAVGVYV
ncbi:uncharacterized protein MEPE_03496 [Melanopsichium pennsylvanicum]|uniref:Dolichyl-diphosphooligosaccharide-protein glycosyltransferase subunit OST5 n=1 Tax=Melanopsichium pennsylvanicum TaxID=63383 RepID=A0AAJ4XM38_9BASI|nr:uncharacterized protein MEPE_03496 [Melanopsichium pennsylvanicum]